MLRIPVRSKYFQNYLPIRCHSSSNFIRSTFIKYFEQNHNHKFVKSSPVVPLCDPTVPFVNAGMNQFKGVFLGTLEPPCPRAVNYQKCIRIGGKHNDLDVVGTDGYHHTFFEMLGNWSFGDYYKEEACRMAWDLLLGPYRLKPENLLVTYFGGDAILGLCEDRKCRDVWRELGVPPSRLKDLGSKENFWEMGVTGPCGPCTEIHYVNPDGTLTEIWNIVFIQCNREADGKVSGLRTHHVDTGMGLERVAAILQGVPSNYDTDLFAPIIRCIERHAADVPQYGGTYGPTSGLDPAYRRLADHARMIAVCLADNVYPANSLNLKQILRKSIKLSTDVFQCKSGMLSHLYDSVAETLCEAYPEMLAKRKEVLLLLEYEEESYKRLRENLTKKWKGLVKEYPEVEALSDIELAGFALGYRELKETMSKQSSNLIPGELVFKLYDTHGFQEEHIQRIANLNNLEIDKRTFWKLLAEHKSKHKTAFKQQADSKGLKFENAIEKITNELLITRTNDQPKYDYTIEDNNVKIKKLKTNLVAILNDNGEWLDYLEPCQVEPYYLVTRDTNFYCEEGGQSADTGCIKFDDNVEFYVSTVFKVRNFVFHKGCFKVNIHNDYNYINTQSDVVMCVDSDKRMKIMRNHTAVHLLNAALRKVLPNSVVSQVGSNVTEDGCSLNLTVYGEKLSNSVFLDAQNLVRDTILSNAPVLTRVIDSVQLSSESSVMTIPGEVYPENGIRLVETMTERLISKELCCGTHVPSTGYLEDFCITTVKGAGSHTPHVHALTGSTAKEARELFCRADKLEQVVRLIDPDRLKKEAAYIKRQLTELSGTSGAPAADYARCLAKLDALAKQAKKNDANLLSIAEAEVHELSQSLSKPYLVHFLRCSYLMQSTDVTSALTVCAGAPAMLFGCANGVIHAACTVPESMVTEEMTAEKWLSCVLPVFQASILPPQPGASLDTLAEMAGTKVSLITCEQLVHDAMRTAIRYANAHVKPTLDSTTELPEEPSQPQQQAGST